MLVNKYLCRLSTLPWQQIFIHNIARVNRSPYQICTNVKLPRWMQIPCRYQVTYAHSPRPLSHINIESNNALFRVGYFDAGPRNGPLVLCVHGAPGGSPDYEYLVDPLNQAGIRVISFNLPGNPLTQLQKYESTYDESPQDRSEFAQNFMRALKIDRVDTLVGHSLGTYPAMNMAATLPNIHSMFLLNNGGYKIHKGVKPHSLCKFLSAATLSTLVGWPARGLMKWVYNRRGFKITDTRHLVSALATAANLDFVGMRKDCEAVNLRTDMPIMFAFTQNDRLIEWEISKQAATCAGVPESNITYLDAEENVISGPALDERLAKRVLIFERGGHFILRSHRAIILDNIIWLVHHTASLQNS